MGESYTELFFLDEAVALAAGHRPCFECRRREARAFAAAWAEAFDLPAPPRAPDMDARLHAERLGPRRRGAPAALPEGAMFAVGAALGAAGGAAHTFQAGVEHVALVGQLTGVDTILAGTVGITCRKDGSGHFS